MNDPQLRTDFFRSRAAEAARQAHGAVSQKTRERCEGFDLWWSALADASESGDLERAEVHSGKVLYLLQPHEIL